MNRPIFDKQEQLDRIMGNLLPGEQVIAVYDCKGAGTGFVGLTTKRVILQDNSFVGGKVAITSVPYSRVSSVSMVSDKSMFGKFASSSSLSISAGASSYFAEFRDVGKAKHAHDVILHSQLVDPEAS